MKSLTFSNVGEETDDEVSNSILFSQAALNDLVRDLNLSKDKSQLLGSRLKDGNLLAQKLLFLGIDIVKRNC